MTGKSNPVINARKKNDALKPRPKMNAYAFFVQLCREEHKRKFPEEQVVFTEFSRKCADRWKTMSETEKSVFNKLAEGDKKRYNCEVDTFNNEKLRWRTEQVKNGRRRDPDAPKPPRSSFFLFCTEERPKVKRENPNMKAQQVTEELNSRWSELAPEKKTKFEKLAEKDTGRFMREKERLKSKDPANIIIDTDSDSD